MDFPEPLKKWEPFIKQNLLVVILGTLGLTFLIYGLIALFASSGSSKEIIFEAGNNGLSSQEKIAVDVEGAVIKPGVYSLASNSRLQDALIMAGGLSDQADREWVAKNLNLATKLIDGSKIYIPKIGESIKSSKGITGITSNGKTIDQASGLINVNSASLEELDTLPGIGPVTAEKIISNRPYISIEELLNKKVVGSKVFEQIKEKISVY